MKPMAVDLDRYATQYDLLNEAKPSYRALLDEVCHDVLQHTPDNARVGDFGAGTGNLMLRLAAARPQQDIVAIELNPTFFSKLQQKVSHPNIHLYQDDICQKTAFDITGNTQPLDAACCIHVLNYTRDAPAALRNIHAVLRPGGMLVVADIGRVLSLWKHGMEIFNASRRQRGLWATFSYCRRFDQVVKQNRRFRKGQKAGVHPLHSTRELVRRIEEVGFRCRKAHARHYLGDTDYVLATKI